MGERAGFDEQPPGWQAEGDAPGEMLSEQGWQPGQKPAAGVFNWFFNRVSRCLGELQARVLEDEALLEQKEDGALSWKVLPAATGIVGAKLRYALDQKGWVQLRGYATKSMGAPIPPGTNIATLPLGYRPAERVTALATVEAASGNAADVCVVYIHNTGVVQLAPSQFLPNFTGGLVQLDGVRFLLK